MFFATNTVMVETVASVRLFFTNSFRVEFFGLDFLPAFAGDTVTLTSGADALGSGFWATATPATARDNTAANAAIRYLRKDSSSGDGEFEDRGGGPGWCEPIRILQSQLKAE